MTKVVLITGASAGIGRACADRLHGAGWSVVSVGKVQERVGLVAKRLLPFRVFEAAAKRSLGLR